VHVTANRGPKGPRKGKKQSTCNTQVLTEIHKKREPSKIEVRKSKSAQALVPGGLLKGLLKFASNSTLEPSKS
jgi:hypothetical protein